MTRGTRLAFVVLFWLILHVICVVGRVVVLSIFHALRVLLIVYCSRRLLGCRAFFAVFWDERNEVVRSFFKINLITILLASSNPFIEVIFLQAREKSRDLQ